MLRKMVVVMKKVSEKYEENVKAVRKLYPKALVFDVTAEGAMKKLDPDFPVGDIRIPGKMRNQGLSLNSVWEGLKVFKKKDEIDEKWMKDENKLGKRRGCKSWGEMTGIKIKEELVGIEEGKKIFREMYVELVKEKYGRIVAALKREANKRPVVLLDYKEERERPFNHVEVLKEIIG